MGIKTNSKLSFFISITPTPTASIIFIMNNAVEIFAMHTHNNIYNIIA